MDPQNAVQMVRHTVLTATLIGAPLLLLFVLIEGWHLVVEMLLASF